MAKEGADKTVALVEAPPRIKNINGMAEIDSVLIEPGVGPALEVLRRADYALIKLSDADPLLLADHFQVCAWLDKDIGLVAEHCGLVAVELSKRSHEAWTIRILASGWGYGREHSDIAKTTPWLVGFDHLPEHMKMLDWSKRGA